MHFLEVATNTVASPVSNVACFHTPYLATGGGRGTIVDY
jgi:hypothetical protein